MPRHIIERGNHRAACYYAEAGYRRYLDELAGLSMRFGCAIQAFERGKVVWPLLVLDWLVSNQGSGNNAGPALRQLFAPAIAACKCAGHWRD